MFVYQRANINTSFTDLQPSERFQEWLLQVPDITLPILGSQTNEFLEIRFSFNDQIRDIYFFAENQNLILHSGKLVLIKEENNWLLKFITI